MPKMLICSHKSKIACLFLDADLQGNTIADTLDAGLEPEGRIGNWK
jgi:hypothetical protein